MSTVAVTIAAALANNEVRNEVLAYVDNVGAGGLTSTDIAAGQSFMSI